MKKFLAMFLASVMALSLVACGGSSGGGSSTAASEASTAATEASAPAAEASTAEAEATDGGDTGTAEPVSLTFWTYPVGGWGNSETVDALLASFNEQYPDITVTVEYLDY